MSLLKNKKFRSDLTFTIVGGSIYIILSIFMTIVFSLSEGVSFFMTLGFGFVFTVLNGMKINGKFKKLTIKH